MTKQEKRRELKERFERLYKGKRLLAIQLDGFTHRVIFDNGSKDSKIEQETYSAYLGSYDSYDRTNTNTDKVKCLFIGYPNYSYQNHAEELCYIAPNER